MKFKEIKGLTVEELEKKLMLSREDYFASKMKHAFKQLSNTDYIRRVRRDIAKIQTALAQKKKMDFFEHESKGF